MLKALSSDSYYDGIRMCSWDCTWTSPFNHMVVHLERGFLVPVLNANHDLAPLWLCMELQGGFGAILAKC